MTAKALSKICWQACKAREVEMLSGVSVGKSHISFWNAAPHVHKLIFYRVARQITRLTPKREGR